MLEELTHDQILIMACDIKTLERTGTREVEVDELRAMGVLPEVKPGQPKSYAQEIRQKNAEEALRLKKMGKRERRRHQQQLLAEARAREEA